jgi:hypothetical protein
LKNLWRWFKKGLVVCHSRMAGQALNTVKDLIGCAERMLDY